MDKEPLKKKKKKEEEEHKDGGMHSDIGALQN
jgi:hypothetical protein